MEKNDVIITLEVLKANCSKHSRDYQALDYAISSLKTDEAYQLMYEGVEVYDKDTVLWMFRELQLEIAELKSYESADGQDLVMLADIGTLFQQKINNLKED